MRKTVLFLFFILIFNSCRNDDELQSASVNDFVWRGMNSWYYWQANVSNLADGILSSPAQYSSIINGKQPDDLFYSLLYQYNTTPKVDRFSWIVNNVDELLASFSGVSKSNGIDFSLYYKDNGNVNVIGLVNYVVPNSPAALAGIKRGDAIIKVNNAPLTTANYNQLLNESISITIASTATQTSNGIETTGEQNYNLTKTVLEENPVAHYQKFVQNNKNIGYLVYNGFRSNYNDELNAVFASMKADGIQELILDLRYNGGGSVNSTVALGQMITGQFTGQPFVKMEFNSKQSQYNSTDFFTNKIGVYSYSNGQIIQTGEQIANSLNLTRVYILTSSGTASASELIITGLRPYINVITIGSETYGKFVGSNTIFDSPSQNYLSYNGRNKNHNWAMQPITFAYFNGNKDPNPLTGGIVPNHVVNPYTYFGNIKEFGNTSDPALALALNLSSSKNSGSFVYGIFQKENGFLASKKTLSPFETEVYIENMTKKTR